MNFSFIGQRRKRGWNSESGCTGLEIAALVAAGAGTGLQMSAAQGEKAAMNKTAEAELMRQQDYAKRGQQVFENSLQQSTPVSTEKQIGAGTDKALQEYAKVQALPTSTSTAGDLGKAVSDSNVQGQSRISNAQLAPLQGYDAYSVSQWIKDLQANSQLRQNSNFAEASNRVLPLELQTAQHSQDSLAGIGSLLSTAGSLAGVYGAVNAPASVAGASGAFTTPTGGLVTQGYLNSGGMFLDPLLGLPTRL